MGRCGIFTVAENYVREDARNGNFDVLKAMFEDIYPLHTETNPCIDQIRYYAYSPLFEDIEIGMMVPEYELLLSVHVDDNGNKTYIREIKKKGI